MVYHTREQRPVEEIAFLLQISPALVRQYQALDQRYDQPAYRERIDEVLAMVKANTLPAEETEPGSPVQKRGRLR